MDVIDIIWNSLTIISFLSLIYWYLTRNLNYWTKLRVKGPTPLPIVGTNLAFLFTPLAYVENKWFQKYGKIYGKFNKEEPMLTIADPKLIKDILVKDFHLFVDRKFLHTNHEILDRSLFNARGEDWKRLRSIMSPTFTSGKMKKMYPMVRECLQEFIDHLRGFAKDRKNINLKEMHGNYTLDSIATCAFATKTNSHKDPNNPFMANLMKVLEYSVLKMFAVILLPKSALNLLHIKYKNNEKANEFFFDLTRHIIRQRKDEKSGNKYNDFIQLLVDAEKDRDDIHDENDKDEAHHVNEGEEELEIEKKTLSVYSTKKQLTENEIMAQGWLVFIAAYDTTSSTLAFCSYELALHQEIQDRLFEEVQSAVDSEGEISYEVLARLPYLDSVISETLRLYPPIVILERKAMTDYRLGDTGITLYKGQDIEIPVFAIHHSEEYYPNAHQFNPDRFMPHNRQNIVPYTYLPFGAGPRNCIGMRFALMEAKLGLAQIVRRFRFFRSEQTAVPLKFKSMTRAYCSENVVIGVEERL